jgi:hypothetical protein
MLQKPIAVSKMRYRCIVRPIRWLSFSVIKFVRPSGNSTRFLRDAWLPSVATPAGGHALAPGLRRRARPSGTEHGRAQHNLGTTVYSANGTFADRSCFSKRKRCARAVTRGRARMAGGRRQRWLHGESRYRRVATSSTTCVLVGKVRTPRVLRNCVPRKSGAAPARARWWCALPPRRSGSQRRCRKRNS